ncbi:MAG: hypothetical protein WKG07_09710 [Hymenobacter sp.]
MNYQPYLLALALLATGPALAQRPAPAPLERGTLTKGQPTGVWDYFDEAGQLELRMNYDSSRISYRRPDTARYELRVGDALAARAPRTGTGPAGQPRWPAARLAKAAQLPRCGASAAVAGRRALVVPRGPRWPYQPLPHRARPVAGL